MNNLLELPDETLLFGIKTCKRNTVNNERFKLYMCLDNNLHFYKKDSIKYNYCYEKIWKYFNKIYQMEKPLRNKILNE